MQPDYLIIGHVTQDITPNGPVWGGTAYYAAMTAVRLGWRVAVVTATHDPDGLRQVLPGVALEIVETAQTTTFENRYVGEDRTQYLHAVAPPLTLADVPEAWRGAVVVHLAPIAQDVDVSLLSAFEATLLGVTPQGWLRRWGKDGRVSYTPLPHARHLLRRVNVLIFSAEDVPHDPVMQDVLQLAPELSVMTQAAAGAKVYSRESAHVYHAPPRPAQVIDPTGAGDVFAAAYLLRLHETGDPYAAADYANGVASFSIEQEGVAGIPTRAQVDAWHNPIAGE